MAVVNAGVLLWLHAQPMPPSRLPEIETVPDPYESTLKATQATQAAPPSQDMAVLDAILAQRLIAESTSRGVVPALPDDTLRQAAASATADSDAALSLLAAYERAWVALGLSLDGSGQ